jgi:long-chain acyl-CoA synthetase
MSTDVHANNLVEVFEESVRRFPDRPVFGSKTGPGQFVWVTYAEVGSRVDQTRAGLALLGVGRGDTVGIIANNRVEWAVGAFAAYGRGARWVPMYEAELAETWKYILRDSGVKVLLASTAAIGKAIEAMRPELPNLEHIVVLEGEGESSLSALQKRGAEHPEPSLRPEPDEIACLIYTSGTTAAPKGVLLSHGNFTSNARAGHRMFPELDEHDRSLAILPWAHSYGQTAELYNFLQIGGSIGLMESVASLPDDLLAVRPTYLLAVPRVFHKIHDAVLLKMSRENTIVRRLFDAGLRAAHRRRESGPEALSPIERLTYAAADKLVFGKIRDRFGGRLRGALTAGATMNTEVSTFFHDIGIPVYDCYGLSETSPAVTMNSAKQFRLGSVGLPIENVRVELDKSVVDDSSDEGEIVVYGPNVMKGYHNKPDETREVMTAEGGFRTGDRGRIDADGFLYVTGRLKEQYKLENGKYVFPATLEEEIRTIPGVASAMVSGAGKRFNIALVVPDFVGLTERLANADLPEDPKEVVARADVQTYFLDAITALLKGKYGGYEIPKKVILLAEDFTVENGMLTQTMKLKRRNVVLAYQDRIDAAYASD